MLRFMYSQGKKHPSIIPLFFCMALGMSGAAAYMLRIALFSPDCSWDKRKNPEPWNKLKPTDQYKESELLLIRDDNGRMNLIKDLSACKNYELID